MINQFSPITNPYKEIKVKKKLKPTILFISQIPIQLEAPSLWIEIDLIGENRTAYTSVLIDSGATSNFINYWFVQENQVKTTPIRPILVNYVEGEPLEGKPITARVELDIHILREDHRTH